MTHCTLKLLRKLLNTRPVQSKRLNQEDVTEVIRALRGMPNLCGQDILHPTACIAS